MSDEERVESSWATGEEAAVEASEAVNQFPCAQCGAKLVFEPGTTAMACQYCGHQNAIAEGLAPIEELDFHAQLAALSDREPTEEIGIVKCDHCAAEIERPEHLTSFDCPYCGSNLVASDVARRLIKPKSLLPFHIKEKAAREAFRSWLKKLWFAPSKLKEFAREESRLDGLYTPYWTYDCDTITDYTGQRGDDYWVTETYTTTENGKTVVKTRQVRKTRWTWVSGRVYNTFDDILVVASQSLPRKYAEKLEPWDLQNLVPFADEFVAGFKAEAYQIDLDDGFVRATELMEPTIRMTIRSDIGGDHQRISSMDVHHKDITFKHVLLPVWITSYRFKDRVFRILVNARTGEVQGERPYSFWKIFFAVLGGLAVIGVIVLIFAMNK